MRNQIDNNSLNSDENQILISQSINEDNYSSIVSTVRVYKSYKRRFYILNVFALLAFMQGLTWNTFGPLEDSTKILFHWSTTITALMPNLGCLALVITFPFIQPVYSKGEARLCVLLGGIFLSIGTAIRCFYINNTYFTVASAVCAFMSGVASTFLNSMLSFIPALWFPDNERITATAYILVLNMIGSAISFLAGVYVLPSGSKTSHEYLSTMKQRLMNTMYMQCGACVFLTLCTIVYFPSGPPTPPTRSAEKPRMDIFAGFKQILKLRNFWILNVPVGILVGIYFSYIGLMATILRPLDVSQEEAGWIGFISSVSCILGSLVIARFTDQIKLRCKQTLLIITSFIMLFSYWLLLMAYQTIPTNKACVYAASILVCLMINASTPIFYDLLCETCFPVSEIVVITAIVLYNNFLSVVFFFIVMIPGMDPRFIIASLPCAAFLCIPSLLLYSQNFKRFFIDRDLEI